MPVVAFSVDGQPVVPVPRQKAVPLWATVDEVENDVIGPAPTGSVVLTSPPAPAGVAASVVASNVLGGGAASRGWIQRISQGDWTTFTRPAAPHAKRTTTRSWRPGRR